MLVAGAPDDVPHLVGRGEVEERRRGRDQTDHGINRRRGPIREEHGPGLRVERQQVTGAVIFLVGTGLLVLPDEIGVVFVNREACGHARLHMRAHVQLIHVEVRCLVLHEGRRLPQRGKGLGRAHIHAGPMRIAARGQIDVRTRDMQEAERIARGQRAGLVRVDDVVGNG